MGDVARGTRDAEQEPVAIIGMSCRFAPDLDSPGKLWTYLAEGRSTVRDMPDKRWDPYAAAGPQATAILRRTTRKGSYLDDIEGFDADFFGISPREADHLDPQQRIVLELAWEALVDAGVAPLSLGGSEAGVFVSANSNDYGRRLLEDLPRSGAYAVNGTTFYGMANRISYALDLRGPSMAVDTACAGSLTALHLACQSLRLGESPVAIVGGVNVMATPALFVALDAAGATSPDGRSKAFDRAADGYGRGEGAGVVVLKPLADARRDGDPVLAVIRGSGVFQDGRSDGMMAPNGSAQEHMLRRTYARAGIAPRSVDYVEAHGTGTPAGDREEAQALAGVFGAGRTADDPCLVGSVKPNLGHTEAGSGIAGLIKTVLALRHGQIPPSLHTAPNPDFDWASSGLRLVAERTPWPSAGRPRLAGVSSYGVGGSIAHLIVEEAPADAEPPAPGSYGVPVVGADSGRGGEEDAGAVRAGGTDGTDGRAAGAGGAGASGRAADAGSADAGSADGQAGGTGGGGPVAAGSAVFPLSAMSEGGLRELAARTADWLDDHRGVDLASVGHTLALRRSHLAQRAAVVAADAAELSARLRAVAGNRRTAGVAAARTTAGRAADVVMVFSGHGAQWSGMGRQLLDREPAFTAAIDSLADVFREETGWTPREAITGGGPWTSSQAQAMTFAMQIGLAEVWRAHGVRPGAVVGHSVGEIAAAVAAGVLDVREAARFACRRAGALRQLEGAGAMALVALAFEEAAGRLHGRKDVVAAIAASPHSTVVSGDAEAVRRAAAQWRAEGLGVWDVDTDIAFHSAHADAVVGEVAAAAGELRPRPPRVPLYSTALEDPRGDAPRDSAYWAANLRQPVRFAAAVAAAVEDGHRLFLEVSSHPVVAHSVRETFAALGAEDAVVAHTLRRDTPEHPSVLAALAELYCAGAAVDWRSAQPAGSLLALPGVAWQHRPYWIFPQAPGAAAGPGGGHDPERHSLLGGRMTVSGAPPRQVWQTYLDLTCRPYPQDHLVVGVEITPAASIINTFAIAAARDGRLPGLSDIVLRTPLAVTPPRVVQVVLSENSLRLASRVAPEAGPGDGTAGPGGGAATGAGGAGPEDEEYEWITHTTAIADPGREPAPGRVDAAAVRERCDDVWDWPRVDALFTTKGVGGYAFPWGLDELRRSAGEQLSVLTLEPGPARHAASWAHVVDGALTISAVLVTPEDAHRLWMSSYMGGVAFRGEPPARITVHTRRSDRSPEDTVDVLVADDTGAIVCEVTGLRFAPLQDQTRGAASARDLVHEIVWRPRGALAGGGREGAAADTAAGAAPDVAGGLPDVAGAASHVADAAAEAAHVAADLVPGVTAGPDGNGAGSAGAAADAGPGAALAASGIVLVGDAPDAGALAADWERVGVPVTRLASAEDAEPALLAAAGAVVVAPALPGPGEPVETAAEHCAWTLIRTAQRLASARSAARASAPATTTSEAVPDDRDRTDAPDRTSDRDRADAPDPNRDRIGDPDRIGGPDGTGAPDRADAPDRARDRDRTGGSDRTGGRDRTGDSDRTGGRDRTGGPGADPRLWVLTRGVRDAAEESSLAHGPLWGVARIVAGEHPEIWGGAVDLGVAPERTDAAALLRVFGAMAGEEDVVSLAGGQVAVPRLAAVDRPAGPPAVQCRPGGTYLVTGGLGGLGLLVAGWLVDRGATRLLLAGRHGLPPREHWDEVTDPALRRRIDGVLALEALGATVRVLEVDIADRAAVAAALALSAHGLPPVRGVVHAAGTVDDALLGNVDRRGLRRVLAPKADGAMVLHRLFPPGALDFFVLFSSSGQFARLTGQTVYAAANSFLDTLAAHRAAAGAAATSIGWTSWRGVGMSEAIEGTMLEANSRGLEAVSPAEAFRAWSYADRRPAPYQAILKVLPTAPGGTRPPMLRELTAPDTAADEGGAGFVLDWDALPEREAREAVALEVREQVAAELNLAAEEIDFRRPLVELGIDSVMTVALRVRLARRFGLDLPPTVLWDKPTVGALAAHLVENLRPPEGAAPA